MRRFGFEGAAMISHGGWYYLFTSWDRCCLGLKSTYRIVIPAASAPEFSIRCGNVSRPGR